MDSWEQTSVKNWIKIQNFSFMKTHLKLPFAKWRHFVQGAVSKMTFVWLLSLKKKMSSKLELSRRMHLGLRSVPWGAPRAIFTKKTPSYWYENPIINLRQSHERLSFIMGNPIPRKRWLLSEWNAENISIWWRHYAQVPLLSNQISLIHGLRIK